MASSRKPAFVRIENDGVIEIRLDREPDCQEDIDIYLGYLIDMLEKKKTFVTVADYSQRSWMPSAKHRAQIAEVLSDRSHLMEKYCAGIGVVSNSAIMRGAVTAIVWISRMKLKPVMFADRKEARIWARKLLREKTGVETRLSVVR